MKKEISRRNFIKGTAALTAGAALMGLAGCAEEKTPAPAGSAEIQACEGRGFLADRRNKKCCGNVSGEVL